MYFVINKTVSHLVIWDARVGLTHELSLILIKKKKTERGKNKRGDEC